MNQLSDHASIQPSPPYTATDKRASVRHICNKQAVSRPLELNEAMTWGAVLRDISNTGVSLIVCYPFKPGTYLAIDLESSSAPRSMLGYVAHATDQSDGTWLVGCKLVKELNDSDVEILI